MSDEAVARELGGLTQATKTLTRTVTTLHEDQKAHSEKYAEDQKAQAIVITEIRSDITSSGVDIKKIQQTIDNQPRGFSRRQVSGVGAAGGASGAFLLWAAETFGKLFKGHG